MFLPATAYPGGSAALAPKFPMRWAGWVVQAQGNAELAQVSDFEPGLLFAPDIAVGESSFANLAGISGNEPNRAGS